MKDLVFNYNIEEKGPRRIYGTSVNHTDVDLRLKPEVYNLFPAARKEPFAANLMNSELELIKAFKRLIASREITKTTAEKLLDLIEAYAEDKSTKSVDEENLSNSEDL